MGLAQEGALDRYEASPSTPSKGWGWPRLQEAGVPLGPCDRGQHGSSALPLPQTLAGSWMKVGGEGWSPVKPFHVLSPLASPQPARKAKSLSPRPTWWGQNQDAHGGVGMNWPPLLPRP